MRGKLPKLDVKLSDKEKAFFEERARQRSAPYLEVIRAKALLLAHEGQRNVVIAEAVGIGVRTISIWRRDFLERREKCLVERARSGRPRSFSPGGQSSRHASGLPEAGNANSS